MSGHALTSLAARRPTGALAGRAMIHPRLPMTRTKFAVKANLLELDGRNIGERPRLSEAAVFISRGENRLLPARAASNWTRGRLHPDHESHRHRAGRSSLRSGRFGLALHHTTPHHTTPHHTTPHHTTPHHTTPHPTSTVWQLLDVAQSENPATHLHVERPVRPLMRETSRGANLLPRTARARMVGCRKLRRLQLQHPAELLHSSMPEDRRRIVRSLT
jgi:hypothetical protein